MALLTPRECYLLARAAEFVLAGEWPWESDADEAAETQHLIRAAEKLRARVPGTMTTEARDHERAAIRKATGRR